MRSLPDLPNSRNQTALFFALIGTAVALRRELAIVHLRLALEKRPRPWWVDRAQHIVRELHRHGCPV